jgi:hypothetical protein
VSSGHGSGYNEQKKDRDKKDFFAAANGYQFHKRILAFLVVKVTEPEICALLNISSHAKIKRYQQVFAFAQ